MIKSTQCPPDPVVENWPTNDNTVAPSAWTADEIATIKARASRRMRQFGLKPDLTSTEGMQEPCDCHCCIHEDGMFCRCEWRVQTAVLREEIARLTTEVVELRARDRIISKQLDLRAGGRDAFTQSLMETTNAAIDRAETAETALTALRAYMQQIHHELSTGRALINAGNVSGGLTRLTIALDIIVEHR